MRKPLPTWRYRLLYLKVYPFVKSLIFSIATCDYSHWRVRKCRHLPNHQVPKKRNCLLKAAWFLFSFQLWTLHYFFVLLQELRLDWTPPRWDHVHLSGSHVHLCFTWDVSGRPRHSNCRQKQMFSFFDTLFKGF